MVKQGSRYWQWWFVFIQVIMAGFLEDNKVSGAPSQHRYLQDAADEAHAAPGHTSEDAPVILPPNRELGYWLIVIRCLQVTLPGELDSIINYTELVMINGDHVIMIYIF